MSEVIPFLRPADLGREPSQVDSIASGLAAGAVCGDGDLLQVWPASGRCEREPWFPMVWADMAGRRWLMTPDTARQLAARIRLDGWLCQVLAGDAPTDFETAALEAEGLVAAQ